MLRTLSAMLLLATLGACAIGPTVDRTPLAREPGGAHLTLQMRQQSLAGELLAVQDTAIVVLVGAERIVLVPYRAIRESDVDLAGTITAGGRTPTAAQRERLRRISRYPTGIDVELQRTLLAAYGQARMEVIAP